MLSRAAVIPLLVAYGADPDLTDENGDTPLRIAEDFGHGPAIAAAIEDGKRLAPDIQAESDVVMLSQESDDEEL